MSNGRHYCSIINYVKTKHPKLYELIDGACISHTLFVPGKNRNGITFILPTDSTVNKLHDLLNSSKSELVQDILKCHIIQDFLPTPNDFSKKRDDIPTALGYKLEIKSVSSDKVVFASGGEAVLDKNYIPFSPSNRLITGSSSETGAFHEDDDILGGFESEPEDVEEYDGGDSDSEVKVEKKERKERKLGSAKSMETKSTETKKEKKRERPTFENKSSGSPQFKQNTVVYKMISGEIKSSSNRNEYKYAGIKTVHGGGVGEWGQTSTSFNKGKLYKHIITTTKARYNEESVSTGKYDNCELKYLVNLLEFIKIMDIRKFEELLCSLSGVPLTDFILIFNIYGHHEFITQHDMDKWWSCRKDIKKTVYKPLETYISYFSYDFTALKDTYVCCGDAKSRESISVYTANKINGAIDNAQVLNKKDLPIYINTIYNDINSYKIGGRKIAPEFELKSTVKLRLDELRFLISPMAINMHKELSDYARDSSKQSAHKIDSVVNYTFQQINDVISSNTSYLFDPVLAGASLSPTYWIAGPYSFLCSEYFLYTNNDDLKGTYHLSAGYRQVYGSSSTVKSPQVYRTAYSEYLKSFDVEYRLNEESTAHGISILLNSPAGSSIIELLKKQGIVVTRA